MLYQMNGPFPASDVLSIEERTRPGHPSFANLRATRLEKWKRRPDLSGPGIYGLFCKGILYYVGIYTGSKKTTFTGSALDRWDMHLTFFSLRSSEVSFVARSMQKILKLDGAPADEYASLLGGRHLSLDEISASPSPFIVPKHASCTYSKALFATRNWDVFAPGNERSMMDDVSFMYARILPEADTLLTGADAYARYWWAKYEWIQARETRLVKALQPICNSATRKFRTDVTMEDFRAAVELEMSSPLAPFDADRMMSKLRRSVRPTSDIRAAA
ncbi:MULTISPECIES: hypothetical protein [unclassified Rhizobium]|uniref:hypothetical protein n=1 Tax=unclassified Rhizobium TaxID=2613769 RepID=UPI001ADB9074|nr:MULTISPECIES: hypothetical protein [unclassified Rhizobium]MBO9127937.1 hypothetical protein [Rhizobium sp. 16-488-2b]MBO9178514.1 hypothetical protein [Rhizobium sp. 16-488-2a]